MGSNNDMAVLYAVQAVVDGSLVHGIAWMAYGDMGRHDKGWAQAARC